jgi:hypothetical protein
MSDGELKETAASDYRTAPSTSPFASQADELYRERVLRARRMAPEEKLLAGEELFEWACAVTLAGIRDQFPNTNEDERRQILKQRLALREKLERES